MDDKLDAKHALAFGINLQSQLATVHLEYRQINGDLEGSIADFNQAIELNPQDAGAYYNRGLARERKGDYQGAAGDYERAKELKP